MEKMIEEIAQILYHNEGGMTDDDYREMSGRERKGWGKPELDNWCLDCLCEHERDDYRWQARKVVEYFLKESKIIVKSQT